MDDARRASGSPGTPVASTGDRDEPVFFDPVDGNALGVIAPSCLVPGDQLGRYVIEAEIGHGAMGRVYRARDPLAARMVAVKTVRGEFLARPAAAAYQQRMQREAHAAGRLAHPNVVRIFDGGQSCLIMELLNGVLLSELLRVRGAVPVEEALAILGPVADALDHAHGRKVIHRDVKPANVMVLRDGSPRLLDFGFALFAGERVAPGDKFLGTPAYMAPEQIADGVASPLTDQFALAVVAYQMLTGVRPFEGDNLGAITYRVVFEDPLAPTAHNPRLPAEFDEVFARALCKSPGGRFATASSFTQALSAHAALEKRLRAPLSPPGARRRRLALDETLDLAADRLPRAAAPAPPAVRPAPPDGETVTADRCALQLESDPVGATVWVDGILAGTTPLALMDLAPGTHTLRIHEDAFAPLQMVMDLWPSAVAPRVRVVLHPVSRAADLLAPPGARLRVAKATGQFSLPLLPPGKPS